MRSKPPLRNQIKPAQELEVQQIVARGFLMPENPLNFCFYFYVSAGTGGPGPTSCNCRQ